MRLERTRETVVGKSRRLYRRLRVHAKHVHVEEDLQHRLRLNIAAGRTERHQYFSAFEGQRRIRRKSRPFTRPDRARMRRVGP